MDLFFTGLKVRVVAYLSLTVLLSYCFMYFFPLDTSPWLFYWAMVFSIIPYLSFVTLRLIVVSQLGVAMIIMAVFLAYFGNDSFLMIPLFGLLSAFAILARDYKPRLAWVTLIVILYPVIAMDDNQTLDIIFAIFVLLITQLTFAVGSFEYERLLYFYKMVQVLKRMNSEIFACFLDPDYAHNIYIFEQRIHKQKRIYHYLEQTLSAMIGEGGCAARRSEEYERLSYLKLIYQHMQDYSILRWRVTDYTSFSLCIQEIKGIEGEISICLDQLYKKLVKGTAKLSTTALSYWIKRLDDNYHNVLQVASREPLVFALFVDALMAFKHDLSAIAGGEEDGHE